MSFATRFAKSKSLASVPGDGSLEPYNVKSGPAADCATTQPLANALNTDKNTVSGARD